VAAHQQPDQAGGDPHRQAELGVLPLDRLDLLHQFVEGRVFPHQFGIAVDQAQVQGQPRIGDRGAQVLVNRVVIPHVRAQPGQKADHLDVQFLWSWS